MTRRGARGGIALPAALGAVAVSAALAGAVAELTRVETLIARHRRTEASALAAADGCLAEMLAGLPAGWDFAAVVAGPDGRAGTADDGIVAAPPGCTGTAAPAPGTGSRLLLGVDARAAGGRRAVTAVAGRAAAPGAPALLWLSALPASGAVVGELALDGADPSDATAADAAGIAAPGEPEALDAWAGRTAVTATPRTGPPVSAPSPPLTGLFARLRAAGPAGAGALVTGTPPTARTLVEGDLVVETPLRGAGLLAVDGFLDVQSTLDFSGVVVATRGIRVTSSGRLTVAGALWLGPGEYPEGPLRLDGALALRQSKAAVTAADGLLPLPRLAVLFGLRDLGA